MYVVKVGGSLINHAESVMSVLKEYEVLIVPGGGIFADTVRDVHSRYHISQKAAHIMAIAAMDQYGHLLADIAKLPTLDSLNSNTHTPASTPAVPVVFLPYKYLLKNDPFKPSWDITSDTISCHIAKESRAEKFVILTDVKGIIKNGKLLKEIDAKEINDRTCVDRELPGYLRKYRMNCMITDGRSPKKIKETLEKGLCGTLIIGKNTEE